LTYSRAKGLFAGVSLSGSTLREDGGDNKDLYGRKISAKEIILEGKVSTPDAAKTLVNRLQKQSPKNKSN
jgi:lipid-binding SYLF domain-containing protein